MAVKDVIREIIDAAQMVWRDLNGGWSESIYQNAMEAALKEKGIIFEAQRPVPVFFRGGKGEYCVGEGKADLVVWTFQDEKRVAVVVELKADENIKEEHVNQVQKYIQALKIQKKENEEVHPQGILINFVKPSGRKKISEDKVLRECFPPQILMIDESLSFSSSEEEKESAEKPAKRKKK
uniref:Hypothetical conserved protein n=1 Tax=uncultured prokaryote TaxID=198431 RepID=H5SPZ0_9ZZZZ|nr:hypothetical conserved protein [uncultured prokaryote]